MTVGWTEAPRQGEGGQSAGWEKDGRQSSKGEVENSVPEMTGKG